MYGTCLVFDFGACPFHSNHLTGTDVYLTLFNRFKMDKTVIDRRTWLWKLFALGFKHPDRSDSQFRAQWAAVFLASLSDSYLDTEVEVPSVFLPEELSFYEVLSLYHDPAATDGPVPEYVFKSYYDGYVHVPCMRDTFGATILPPTY